MQRNTTSSSGGQAACAACKHQRKKCHGGCVLAPYFPAEKGREFQAVHKVFGVSNVTKMVKSVASEEDRRKAVDSLIWEACCRQRDPVLGPYAEYRKVFEELKIYKSQLVVPSQRTAVAYKSLSGLVGWNSSGIGNNNNNSNNNNNHNNNGIIANVINTNNNSSLSSFFHENGSVVVDQNPFNYASSYSVQNNIIQEKLRQEKNNNNVEIVVPGVLQPSLNNGYNQQYYLSAGNFF